MPLHKELLVAVTTDPEVTRSTVSIERKRPRESELHVGDYRRQLIERMVERMMDARLGDLARKADAKFLGAGVNFGNLNGTVSTFSMAAGVQDGRLEDGLAALATEAQRVKEFGFTASEMDRAKQSIAAFYERAYNERDKTESPSFAAEYLRHFFVGEPTSGIAYEYELVKQLLPTITTNDASALIKSLLNDDSRVVLAVSPQKPGIKIPTEADLQAALKSGTAASVDAWSDNGTTREIMDKVPDPGTVTRADDRRAGRHRGPLLERRRGLAEADRFQERPGAVHAERAWRRVAGGARRLSRGHAVAGATSSCQAPADSGRATSRGR